MHCPNCGKELSNGTEFCGYCGGRVASVEQPVFRPQPPAAEPLSTVFPQDLPPATEGPAERPEKRGRNSKTIILAALAALVVVLTVVLLILLLGGKKKKNAVADASTDAAAIVAPQDTAWQPLRDYAENSLKEPSEDHFTDQQAADSPLYFGTIIRDMTGDGISEMVSFSAGLGIEMDLFEYDSAQNTVVSANAGEALIADNYPLFVNRIICGTYENDEIRIYIRSALPGEKSTSIDQYSAYKVNDHKPVKLREFLSTPDQGGTYRENVSGTVYETKNQFMEAVRDYGFHPDEHAHNDFNIGYRGPFANRYDGHVFLVNTVEASSYNTVGQFYTNKAYMNRPEDNTEPFEAAVTMAPAAPAVSGKYSDLELQNIYYYNEFRGNARVKESEEFIHLIGTYNGYTYYSTFDSIYRTKDPSGMQKETICADEKKVGVYCQIVNDSIYFITESENAVEKTAATGTYKENAYNIIRTDLNGNNKEILLEGFGSTFAYSKPTCLVLNNTLYVDYVDYADDADYADTDDQHQNLYAVNLNTKEAQLLGHPKKGRKNQEILFANDRYVLINNGFDSELIYNEYLVFDRATGITTLLVPSQKDYDMDIDLVPESPFTETEILFVSRDGVPWRFSLVDGSFKPR